MNKIRNLWLVSLAFIFIGFWGVNAQSSSNASTFNEKNAEFVGGEQELRYYIMANISYPEKAQRRKIEGKVFVSFIVEPDGSLSNIVVTKGHSLLRKEGLRLVKNMPKWKPAELGDLKIREKVLLPINFEL